MLNKLILKTEVFEQLTTKSTELLSWFAKSTSIEKELVMQYHSVMFTAKEEQVEIDNKEKFYKYKKNRAKFSLIILLYAIYICKDNSFKKLHNRDEANKLLAEIKDERTLKFLQKKKHSKFKEKLNRHYSKIYEYRYEHEPQYSWDKICKLLRKNYSRYYKDYVLTPSYVRRTFLKLKEEKEIPQIQVDDLPNLDIVSPSEDNDALPDIHFKWGE